MIMLSPSSLHEAAVEALRAAKVDPNRALRADFVVVLLRMNTPEALSCAQELAGKTIQLCPSGMPPWPPKPVAVPQDDGPKLVRKDRNPCLPTSDMFQRYKLLKVGLTQKQLIARGVQRRDLAVWGRRGAIEFSNTRKR